MRILASIFCGWMVWFCFVTWQLAHPEVALLAGIMGVFVCEASIFTDQNERFCRESVYTYVSNSVYLLTTSTNCKIP